MTDERRGQFPFNSALETGIRSVGVLVAAYPRAFDLQQLVAFDHLVVHTGDIGGPTSLHPALPMRSAELLVRRDIVERGLLLMMTRRLVDRFAQEDGIYYRAGEIAETFIRNLTAPYLVALQLRAQWVIESFGDLDQDTLRKQMNAVFGRWIEEFQTVQQSIAGEL